MNQSAAFDAVEYFYRRMYWQAPTAVTQHTPAFTLSYSGVTWLHSINHLWLRQTEAFSKELLAQTAKFFRHYHAEYSIVLSDQIARALADPMADAHLGERASSPIYALSGLPRVHKLHRETQIIRVSPNEQQELLQVLYGAFFMGPEIGRCIVQPDHFDDPSIRHYLAFVDGEAAASTTVLLRDGIAGIWNVGTLRPFRRQGIASTLLMRALADAAEDGYTESVLIASPMGRPMYEQMGYQWIGNLYHYGPGH